MSFEAPSGSPTVPNKDEVLSAVVTVTDGYNRVPIGIRIVRSSNNDATNGGVKPHSQQQGDHHELSRIELGYDSVHPSERST